MTDPARAIAGFTALILTWVAAYALARHTPGMLTDKVRSAVLQAGAAVLGALVASLPSVIQALGETAPEWATPIIGAVTAVLLARARSVKVAK